MDRTYWHVPGARSWHALVAAEWLGHGYVPALCGRSTTLEPETADRVPPNAHLCGSCSRVIAARTDIEAPNVWRDLAALGRRVESDIPEPVASDQDDYRGAAPV